MKRVLHVTDSLAIGGGVQNFIMNYYMHINRKNIQFDFLLHSNEGSVYEREIKLLGGRIFRVPYNNKLKTFFQIIKLFRKLKECEIVHVHSACLTYLVAGIVARMFGKKVIFHSHTRRSKRKMKLKLVAPIFRLVGNKYSACSVEAGKFFFGNDIEKSEKFTVFTNAIDVSKFCSINHCVII